MKNPSARFALALLVAGLCLVERSATAQVNQYWDPLGLNTSPGSGGTGTWDSVSTNWWYTGSSDGTWTNDNIAIFAGTNGTVTLGANETVNGLTFSTSNYTISGSSTLTLAGTPTITVGAGTNTISCAVASSVPVSFSGPGTLNLTHSGGNSGLAGGVTINNGATVAINNVAGLGSTNITNNGTVSITVGASSVTDQIYGSGIWDVNIPYSTSSENIRYALSSLANYSGTMNLIAGLSSGAPGVGQIIMSNTTASSAVTWNIGYGATLDIAPGVGTTFNASRVIINGPGNSQPYGALRLDACTLNANVLLNGSGCTIGNASSPTGPCYISGVISDGGNHYGFTSTTTATARMLGLQGANTYTGPTILGGNSEPGTVELDSAETPGTSGPLGASPYYNPGSIVFNGGQLIYSTNNAYDYSGRFSTNASQSYNINLKGQSVTFASPLASSGGTLTLADTAGSGVLTLSATNTYTGGTTLSSGTLNISGRIAGTVLTANGGTLQLDNPSALPAATILTLPASPASSMVNLNFTGVQTITTLNFGSSPQPSGTYGSMTNNSVQYQNAAFTGNGILNVQPPTYWDPTYTKVAPGSGGPGSWDSTSTNWLIGSTDTKWVSNNVANFAGTAGTVTLNANETADGVTFNTDSYLINGTSTLTLGGTPIITLSGNAEMDCPIAGTGGLTESGSGTLTLGGSNSFTGGLSIAAGDALVLNGVNAFQGATTIGSGGSLTVGASGNLGNGAYSGAIVNNSLSTFTYHSSANQALSGIMSGSGSVDEEGPGSLNTSGLNTFTGGITINGGTYTISGAGDLGNNPTFNTGGYSGAIADNTEFIYSSSAPQTLSGQISGTGAVLVSGSGVLTFNTSMAYSGPTTIASGSELIIGAGSDLGNGDYETNLTNNGQFVLQIAGSQILGGPISGSGSLTMQGSGSLTLNGTNTYGGATTVSSGNLILGATASISNSTSISLAANANMDVSALPSFALSASNSLSATGSGSSPAYLNGPSAGTVSFGARPVSLNFTPQNFTGDSSHPALILSQGALALGGNSVSVRNSGASPLGLGTYTLIQVGGGTITGGAALNGTVSGAGLAPGTAAALSATNGELDLVVSPAPASPPVINSLAIKSGNLIFSGTNGSSGGTYYVLASTNVMLPLAQWTPIATNSFSVTGAFSVTNAIGIIPYRFFSIEMPGQ